MNCGSRRGIGAGSGRWRWVLTGPGVSSLPIMRSGWISVFLPYDRPPQHEDQLTRAAMIIILAVPLARDALLARLGAPTSARLPDPDLDMQTNYVMAPT